MPVDQPNTRELMAMANKFSGCRIDPKYFPVMFDSRLIMEPLCHIYILRRNKKLSLEDNQKIKRIFRDSFSFFAKQYNKKYLILSVIFFSCLLFSGVGCVYLPIIFAPLLLMFAASLVISVFLVNIRTYPFEITCVHDDFKHELLALMNNLNDLKDDLINKYSLNVGHDVCDCADAPLANNTVGDSERVKKTVSFSPKLNVNIFFQESYEFRSRTNSYENSHLQPRG